MLQQKNLYLVTLDIAFCTGKLDISTDAHIKAAAGNTVAIPRNLGTVDANRCVVRYIIGEKMFCCPNGCWDKFADCQKSCKP